MTNYQLQVLVEIDCGEFHIFQSVRYEQLPQKHAKMMDALESLKTMGYINIVGEDYVLSNEGDDVLQYIYRSNVLTKQ